MKFLFAIVAILVFISGEISAVNAQKYLTGELSGTYPADEYVVSGNIHVLPKTRLTFDPGSILRFENYTGIVVRGEIICSGTPLKPIIFTSSRDIPSSRTMPEAFDWNGIKVTSESDGITLVNCVIAYSTFGLTIESNATPVSIKATKFNNNGSASLTRERKMMPVTENREISFVWPEIRQTGTVSDSAENDGSPQVLPNNKPKKVSGKKEFAQPKEAWIPPVRITMGSAAAVGGIMWVAGFIASGQNKKITQDPNANVLLKNSADTRLKNWLMVQNLGIGLCCIGAIGFSVTFLF